MTHNNKFAIYYYNHKFLANTDNINNIINNIINTQYQTLSLPEKIELWKSLLKDIDIRSHRKIIYLSPPD